MKTRLFIIGLLMTMGVSASSQSHYIGEILAAPDGQQGIVFYVAPNGEDYWMVAMNDLPQPYKWGNLTDIPDLDNQDESFFLHYNPCGYDATVAMKEYQNSNPDYAASAINTKHYWCIPSTGQASKLYAALPYIQHLFAQYGGTVPGTNFDHYWTSTEYAYNQAYVIYLGIYNYQGGALMKAYKDELLGVRPVWCLSCSSNLPIVGQIDTPDEICSGSSLTLEAPETQNASYGGWQIAANANFNNYQEYHGEELDDSYSGWYLRYYAHNILGNTYSNVVQISILPVITSSFSIESCDSYTWNDVTYTESGTYQQHFPIPNSCDSIVTLHLSIGHNYSTSISITSCESFTWNGAIYTQSGNYEQIFTTHQGCDSIVTLHLTINPSPSYEFSISTCETFIWNGTKYTQSGDYEQHFTSSTGCDSIATLHLTIESFEEMQTINGDTEIDSHYTPISIYVQPGFVSATSYQWSIEPADAATLNANGGNVIVNWSPEFNGIATLKVHVSNDCGEGDNEIIVNVKNSSDVSENNINAKLYPNPTSGDIIIEAVGMQHLTVINTLGQTIVDMELDTDSVSIDMAPFGKGIYLIRIQTQNGSCTKRIGVE